MTAPRIRELRMDNGCVAIESPGLEIAQLHQSFDQGRSASEDPLGDPRIAMAIS